jgi:hypothetical protein
MLQAADRVLADLLVSTSGCGVSALDVPRVRVFTSVTTLIEMAQEAGVLQADFLAGEHCGHVNSRCRIGHRNLSSFYDISAF